MKKKGALYLIFTFNLLILFLQVYKQTVFIRLSYAKQKKEKYMQELLEKRNNMNQHLCQLQQIQNIKEYAQLIGMKKMSLKHIKQIRV